MAGKVPTSRTVNGKALSANISLTADNVGAVKYENIGNATSIADAYWNMTRGKVVVGIFVYSGQWAFIGNRYTSGDYGCMIAANYSYGTGVYYLSEIEGTVKLYKLNMTLQG